MPSSKSGAATLRAPIGLMHMVMDSATLTEQAVSARSGYLRALLVNETLDAPCAIKIDGALFHTIPAGTPPGPYPLYDVEFDTALAIDFDAAATTGNFAIIYDEYNF